jgi:hypothetical protein
LALLFVVYRPIKVTLKTGPLSALAWSSVHAL